MTRTATARRQAGAGGHPWRITSLDPAWRVRPQRKAWFVRALDERNPPSAAAPSTAAPGELVGAFAQALLGAQTTGGNARIEADSGEDREHGDRHRFLAEARRRLAADIARNRVHPRPAPDTYDSAHPPRPRFDTVDGSADRPELVAAFARTATEAGAVCHVVEGDIPEPLLDHLVSEFEAWAVVVSAEPEAQALADRLGTRGAEVHPATPAHAAQAVMGITSASAGVAATGSVLLDSAHTGSRVVSALPAVHVCVLPADRIVASPSDVLRPLGESTGDPAASLVLVTGPSRSGEIEQILTVGAHGPTALHIIVTM